MKLTFEKLSRHRDKFLWAALLIPCLLWSYGLRKEAVFPGYDSNDTKAHESFVRLFYEHFKSGSLGLDAWDNHCCFGIPGFRMYQNLGHFVAAGLNLLTSAQDHSGFWVHFLIALSLVLQIPFFYWACRRMGFPVAVSLAAAWLSPLIDSAEPIGHEFRTYVFIGFGVFSQALAVPFFMMALSGAVRITGWVEGYTVRPWRDGIETGFWLALTFLVHHFYGYMGFLCLGVLGLFSLSLGFAGFLTLVKAAFATGSVFLVGTSYQLLSIVQDSALAHQTPWYQKERWDGMGVTALWDLIKADLIFDYRRWPVFGGLALVGLIVTVLPFMKRSYRSLIPLSGIAFVFCAGRTSFGGWIDWLPGIKDIHLERFIGLIHMVGILLAAVGLGELWRQSAKLRQARFAVCLLLIVSVGYLVQDRLRYLGTNDDGIEKQLQANSHFDPQFFKALEPELSRGNFWSFRIDDLLKPYVGRVPFYNMASYLGYAQLSAAEQSITYPSDIVYLFQPYQEHHYRVLNVAGLILPRSGFAIPKGLREVYRAADLVSYKTSAIGMWDVVGVSKVEIVPTSRKVNDHVHAWLSGKESAFGLYPAFIPQSVAERWPTVLPEASPNAESALGKVDAWGRVKSSEGLRGEKSQAVLIASKPGAYGIFRVAYHPNWQVEVNGKYVATKWISPGFLGFALSTGVNEVRAEFPSDPVRAKLFLFAMAFLTSTGLTLLFSGVSLRRLSLRKTIPARGAV